MKIKFICLFIGRGEKLGEGVALVNLNFNRTLKLVTTTSAFDTDPGIRTPARIC
jgi:hypothetical protein